MTLRVTVEVVPHGDESRKHVTHIVEISQTKKHPDDLRDYEYTIIEHNERIPVGQAGRSLVVGAGTIWGHRRSRGALELLRRVTEDHVLFEGRRP